jgi:hypothetical protein
MLNYQLSDKQSQMENTTDLRVSYTCVITDELGAVLATETVSGACNAANPSAQTVIAGQIGTAINMLLSQTETWRTNDANITAGLADVIAAQLEG